MDAAIIICLIAAFVLGKAWQAHAPQRANDRERDRLVDIWLPFSARLNAGEELTADEHAVFERAYAQWKKLGDVSWMQ